MDEVIWKFRTFIYPLEANNWSYIENNSSIIDGFSNNSSLVTVNVSNWDTSNVTSFYSFAYNCSSLTSLDVSNWNTSNVTNFSNFVYGCTSLTSIICGNAFSNSPCINYSNAFTNTNLSQSSIDNILVSINKAGTSGGTFNQSGGSTPSSIGEAAITALRSRGWTVTVQGGF